MLKFHLLNNKLFNSIKSILFLDYYLNVLVNYVLCNFVNIFSILILERYLLDFVFRGTIISINLNLSNLYTYTSGILYTYSIFLINISVLYYFI